MAHKSKTLVSTQIYGLLSVLALAVGIVLNYLVLPELFGGSIAYSTYGAYPETKYIFSGSLLIAALLFWLESHYIQYNWRRWACYLTSVGFIIVVLVPINQGSQTDLIHGLGASLVLFGLLINVAIGIATRKIYINLVKRSIYILLLGIGVGSAVISILSVPRFGLLSLQGYAEYTGLTVFAAWILLDFGDIFISKVNRRTN